MYLQSRALDQGCRDHKLPMRKRLDEWILPDLDLGQRLAALDFLQAMPAGAVVLGPLRGADAGRIDFDSGGRPLVFASRGIVQKGRLSLLLAIATAASGLDICLALAHCGGLNDAQARAVEAAGAGKVILRDYFPQRAVLTQASACVTHAGLNTVLDCAALQVPMVAIPLAFDQPAVAARLDYHGAARVIAPRRATAGAIAEALRAVLSDPSHGAALAGPAAEIQAAAGVTSAADLIEARLARPVAA